MTSSARDIIAALDLKPHPEGGHYRQTWKADAAAGERAAGTAIYFLLAEGRGEPLASRRFGRDLAFLSRRAFGAFAVA